MLGAAVVMAWLLELGQGANDGQYWQGRYTMPFAIGLPIVLAWRPERGPAVDTAVVDRLAPVLATSAWLIANVAFVAAQQRWAVGIDGSWYPWDWNTWASPIAPALLVVVHAATTAVLAAAVARPGADVTA